MRRLRPIPVLAALALLAACQDDLATPGDNAQIRTQPEGFASRGEVRTGWILENGFHPVEVTYEIQHGRAIFEGDIDLGPVEQIAPTREEALRPSYGVVRDGSSARWPSGVVPYTIDSNVPQQSRVTNAISHIESRTGRPDFVPRTNQSSYVRVIRSTGCASSVGRVG
ncbi:MAG TPA: M12 family metallopeptidase, partial [Longimicrobiaceae bacterium]|nr:M12 family metallopeptidase [Longimicrobiaceae bacterium]